MSKFVNENIKILRTRAGLTQEKLGDLIGVKRSSIGAYEENRAVPPYITLQSMATVFGVTLDEILAHRFANDHTTDSLFKEEPNVVVTPPATEPRKVEEPSKLNFGSEKKQPFSRSSQVHLFESGPMIRYVSSRYFDKYILDDDFFKELDSLPGLKLPFYNDYDEIRAFDVPVGNHMAEGMVICKKVNKDNSSFGNNTYLLVSMKKGFVLSSITEVRPTDLSVTIAGKATILNRSEIKEVWESIGYFSLTLPKPQPDVAKIAEKINALKREIDAANL